MSEIEDLPLIFVPVPKKLREKVDKLLADGSIENPGDKRMLEITLAQPEEITKNGIIWMNLLVKRKGKRYVKDD